MLVQLSQIQLRYGQNEPVLRDINLSLDPGSFHFLIGASGAGKSSLLRLIYLSERANAGRFRLFGRDPYQLPRDELPAFRRRIGVVFQDFRLIPHLTALENAALPLRLAGASEQQVRSHVIELLNWVGLGHRLDALPDELSGGEQQRIAIARAVVNKPTLLLADEPTGNVDGHAAMKLLHLFNELNKMGTAVLLATHQQSLVEQWNKPALILSNGSLSTPVAVAA